MHPDLPLDQILIGDCRELLKTLPDGSVHCVVTSPPYWGLRSYGTDPQIWQNGHEPCIEHQWGNEEIKRTGRNDGDMSRYGETRGTYQYDHLGGPKAASQGNTCSICGCWRGELGLEPTPELYVEHLTQIFREVKRVLRDDGTIWVNLGDSYASQGGPLKYDINSIMGGKPEVQDYQVTRKAPPGLKPKDLVGIPWMVARALQQPYYIGRVKSELDRVWLAATLDAEGTICGFRHERDDGNVRSGILVFITNSDTRMLDHADRIWPGARYLDHNKEGDEVNGCHATRDCYRWQIQEAEERAAFISEIYPYLVSKKQQALIGWNMLQFAIAAKHMGRGGETGEIKDKRELLVRIISDLNHARPVVLPDWLKEPPSLYEPGYYLRSDIIWSKSNPMPESVTDRPTKSHEYIFLLSKSQRYYYDADAVREPMSEATKERDKSKFSGAFKGQFRGTPNEKRWQDGRPIDEPHFYNEAGRNRRTVWTVATHPFKGAHFATFPPKLIEPCILAGTSARGVCPKCGAPWERVIEKRLTGEILADGSIKQTKMSRRARADGSEIKSATSVFKTGMWNESQTTGWRATCACDAGEPVPAVVLDPFMGSGTTASVCISLKRHYIGFDLNPAYVEGIAQDRADNTPPPLFIM